MPGVCIRGVVKKIPLKYLGESRPAPVPQATNGERLSVLTYESHTPGFYGMRYRIRAPFRIFDSPMFMYQLIAGRGKSLRNEMDSAWALNCLNKNRW